MTQALIEDTILDFLQEANPFVGSKDYRKAEAALKLMERYNTADQQVVVHVFVYFPHLLKRYLILTTKLGIFVTSDDMTNMLAMCIEEGLRTSLKHLLAYNKRRPYEIKLMDSKFTINKSLYKFAKRHNVKDTYYEAMEAGKKLPYAHMDITTKDRKSECSVDFRDVFHTLLYGNEHHLRTLLQYWSQLGNGDYTIDAGREYFCLPKSASTSTVFSHVQSIIEYRAFQEL